MGIALLGLFLVACGPVVAPSLPTPTIFTMTAETPPSPTSTSTPSLTPTSTATASATPSSTPIPPPLVEIFPQVGGGEEFAYINKGGVLSSKFVLTKDCVHSGLYGLQIVYNMEGPANGGWGIYWNNTPAKHFDASTFTAFRFWVRGTSGGETFQFGIKDTSKKEVKIEVVIISDWQLVQVSLSDFALKGVNISSIENVSFGFDQNDGAGTICIDDIAFEP